MTKGSEIWQDDYVSDFLSDEEKDALAKAKTPFDILEVQMDTGEWGPIWTLQIVFLGTGETKKLSLSMSEHRDEKFTAWAEWLGKHAGKKIEGQMLTQRRTKAGRQFRDIVDCDLAETIAT